MISGNFLQEVDYIPIISILERVQLSWNRFRLSWINANDDPFDIDKKLLLCSNIDDLIVILSMVLKEDSRVIKDNLKEMHEAKNRGYSPGDDSWKNIKACSDFEINVLDGIVTRICDKYSRFISLYNNPENDRVGEKIEDTTYDFISYLIILKLFIKDLR